MKNEQCLTILTSRFQEALVYAAQLHNDQQRKIAGTPYIAHLLSVAALVLEDGGDEDEAISALLHDALEDRGGEVTRTEILQRFGDRVFHIIEGCTEPEPSLYPTWKEHKQQYLQQLRDACPPVQRVMLADKLHNARTILVNFRRSGEEIWHYFRGGKEGVLWLYQEQLQIYRQLSSSWMVAELERVVRELQQGAIASS
ncbi:HD domain-containing protein [Planktothrix sp. FACHB-1355]|uniref:HD domain-containing protein n=1 Tax=Aerosakkonema funiforme FACHB-1375 TaxID=2949571 RepID=A0A926VC94_9CYAN|nr:MULTISPECIES: HD domain-containing protein [Oscillatoriales]MBD2181234.1 HD domain-containing protein [Aerosakkonema funiforme FACHB-1375]MBD3561445.1 HD domain-containing protein [Planktothrix sp. FACHB-1355]